MYKLDCDQEVQISKLPKQLLSISLSGCGPSINIYAENVFMCIRIKTLSVQLCEGQHVYALKWNIQRLNK